MFSSLSIRKNLMLAFALCSAILAGVGYLAFERLNQTLDSYDHIVKVNYPNYVSLSQIVDNGRRLNIIIARVTGSVLSVDEHQDRVEDLASAINGIEQASKAYLAIPFAPGEEEMWNVVDQRLKMCIDYAKKVLDMSRSTNPDDLKRRDEFAKGYETVRVPYREAMDKLMSFQSRETKKWSRAAESNAEKGKQFIIAMVGGGILLSFAIGYFISSSLNYQLGRISAELTAGADEVAAASGQISATAEELSSSSIEQASAIQETASSVEEMSSMVRKNADNAKRSAETAHDGQEAAENGKEVINEMLKAMSEIDDANREIAEVLKLIGQIENKTKVIDDIVFKTQLLSFNASVEAARAGEHGKGFAVVAEEVGNLAQMSGNAAKEISDMLSQSLDRVDRMIAVSKQKVEKGLDVGRRCGEVFEDLVEKVTEINGMANEIASASDEQARGVAEINKAMTQMDQMTQQNSSAAQQAASSAIQLSQQSELMRGSVMGLLGLLHGKHGDMPRMMPMQNRPHRPMSPPIPKPHAMAKRPPVPQVARVDKSSGAPQAEHPGFDDAA